MGLEYQMNDTRARFEEIWPVPHGVTWSECGYGYEPTPPNLGDDDCYEIAAEWDARLDTFTRCQETTAIHLSLIDELVQEIESCHADLRKESWYVPRKSALLDRAKQIMEQKK
jgi:hypothetical protein